jgi:hypothetical protein
MLLLNNSIPGTVQRKRIKAGEDSEGKHMSNYFVDKWNQADELILLRYENCIVKQGGINYPVEVVCQAMKLLLVG